MMANNSYSAGTILYHDRLTDQISKSPPSDAGDLVTWNYDDNKHFFYMKEDFSMKDYPTRIHELEEKIKKLEEANTAIVEVAGKLLEATLQDSGQELVIDLTTTHN